MKDRTPEERMAMRHTAARIAITIGEIALMALAVVAVMFFLRSFGAAEEHGQMWVLCQPDDYINIRYKASGRSDAIGFAGCGDRLSTDGKTKNGFAHIVDASLETDEAWISERYIVYDEPERINRSATVISNGRLAARQYIGGKVRKWLRNGDVLQVHWMSSEWAITNKGFVKAEYIELDGE